MDELKTNYDAVVIGAGVIGTMTAKALAERGRQTLILERFQLAHKGGSSHGLSRIVRVTDYHPDYVRLNRLAMRGWQELQESAGETLFVRTGNLEVGEGARLCADALDAAGERYEWLAPDAARERWPALRLRADEPMFVQEDGGVFLADRTVRAAARAATKAGAELREGTRVERISNHDTFAEVVIEGESDRGGMVVDFNDLKTRTREVLQKYDHRHWNDVLEFPTVENICALLSRQLKERIPFPLVIRVWEGNGKWAEM